MEFTVKVDRVKNVEEAIALQELGVKLIGVSLGEKSLFDDDRLISKDQVSLIQKSLKSSKLVGDVSSVSQGIQISSLADELNFDYVQADDIKLLKTVEQEPNNRNRGVIYSPVCISYDDDPEWVFDDFDNFRKGGKDYIQLDLFGDLENSWNFLNSKSLEEPDEVQIEDINKLSTQYSIFLTIDFSVENIAEVLKSFPNIYGISFVLGKLPHRNDIHCFDYLEVIKILNSLN
jgi:hypothetical protein